MDGKGIVKYIKPLRISWLGHVKRVERGGMPKTISWEEERKTEEKWSDSVGKILRNMRVQKLEGKSKEQKWVK